MPIYEFECEACGARFEELVAIDAGSPPCPDCGAGDPRRLLSAGFATNKFLSAGDARRKTASRLDKKERAKEHKRATRQREERS